MAAAGEAEVRLNGRVTNENDAPVAAARVSLRRLAVSSEPLLLTTTLRGLFTCSLPAPGDYRLDVERQGYFRLSNRTVRLVDGPNEVHLILSPLREVFESIEVSAVTATVNMDTTVSAASLHGTDILAIPYPTTNNLKNALRIMPGVVQDNRGGVHVNGGAEEQVQYTLDGFNVSDPLTGRFDARVSVEAVQEVEVASGRLPAEFGKGSAGTLAIRTVSGDDRMRYSGTNFIPGFENRKGFALADWTPRLGLSGPIRRGRAWFSDNITVQYSKNVIKELPDGRDRTTTWRASNLLHGQFNVTPSNILYASFLANTWVAPRAGLSALEPVETTTDRRSRQWFFNVKDQIYLARGALVEFGYARNLTFGREIPQGNLPYLIMPEGRGGNAYIDATRRGARDQWLGSFFLPTLDGAGRHQIKTGVDLDRVAYAQDVRRTTYENLRLDGSPKLRVAFGGSGLLERSNNEAAWYVQDAWKPRGGLLVEMGLRVDWDRVLAAWSASPRLGAAWSPGHLENTKISAGYAVVQDATSLRLFTRPLDQYSLATYFGPDGVIARGPAVAAFTPDHGPLRQGKYDNWSLGLEQQLPGHIATRLGYLRKRGHSGLTYINLLADGRPPPPDKVVQFGNLPFDALYRLANSRRDVFDSFEATFRQTIRGKYEWLCSYTRSRALSNAVIDPNVDEPFLLSNNVGRMPWDTPNRLVSWAYLPTPWRDWALAYLLEWRDGFPFSVVGEDGRYSGELNSRRFPAFFELNFHVERRLALFGHRWALRGGFNNITDHLNPNVVNNNADSPNYLRFFGGQDRALNFRIRWLGRL